MMKYDIIKSEFDTLRHSYGFEPMGRIGNCNASRHLERVWISHDAFDMNFCEFA